MNKLLIPSVCLVVLLATNASEARWRIDAEVGAMVGTQYVQFRDDDTSVQLKPIGPSVALGGGYGLGDWVDVTAHYQGSFGVSGDIDVNSITAGGRVYLMPAGRIRPWVTSEIGWYHGHAVSASILSDDIAETADAFGLNAGGGLDVFLNRRVSLGVDVRYHDAFDAFDSGLQFVTTMCNVGVHFDHPDLGF